MLDYTNARPFSDSSEEVNLKESSFVFAAKFDVFNQYPKEGR